MATDRECGHILLSPSFALAFWRSEQRVPFRRHAAFSQGKKHFVPEQHSPYADRFARELAREAVAEEIHRIYENAVALLGEKRSRMEKGETTLEASAFHYEVRVAQDEQDPALVRYLRCLEVKAPLNELPAYFDDLFPWKVTSVVVPFEGVPSRRALLETLEHWEERLKGRLEESVNGQILRLHLRSGFTMTVEQGCRELLFEKLGVEGVVALATALSADLKSLGIVKSLV